jgi:hypothetical protein
VLPHKSNRRRKVLPNAIEIGLSGLANRMIQFYRFRWESRASSALDEGASHPVKRRLDEIGMKYDNPRG